MNKTNRKLNPLVFASVFIASIFGLISCSITPADDSKLTQTSYSDINTIPFSVDDKAPNFNLPDANGQQTSLTELLQQQHVLVLFYRGQWCPFCISQLESFEAVLPKLSKHKVKLVAISPDERQTSQNTQRNFGLDYLFLSDVSLEVIKQYGVQNEADANLPHPAMFLINQQGEVVWFHASKNYKQRPTGRQVLSVIEKRLP